MYIHAQPYFPPYNGLRNLDGQGLLYGGFKDVRMGNFYLSADFEPPLHQLQLETSSK